MVKRLATYLVIFFLIWVSLTPRYIQQLTHPLGGKDLGSSPGLGITL